MKPEDCPRATSQLKLNTRVFKLYKERYRSITELAWAMEISAGYIYKVRQGKRNINQKFIIGAIKAFPGYNLNDLFYVYSEVQPVNNANKLPEFREYACQIYPNELDEDLITMIEDLIERRRVKRHNDDGM